MTMKTILIVIILLLCFQINNCYIIPSSKLCLRRNNNGRRIFSSRTDESTETLLKQGPGHISSMPISMTSNSKKEALKMLLTVAVVWLVLNERFREFRDRLRDTVGMKDDVKVLDTGIVYEDVVVGSSLPEFGDTITMELRMFFNGKRIRPREGIKEPRQSDRLQFVFDENFPANVEAAYEICGVKDALNAIAYGSRRRLRLPASIAFTESTMPSLLDGTDTISIDIMVDPKLAIT